MPHAEIKYTTDLELDSEEILSVIEATILRHDDGSGECKGRAYPTDEYRHTHILVSISMLQKPHRDGTFTKALLGDLEKNIKACLTQSCRFSLSLNYNLKNYITNEHAP